jgi:hypothetical protein
MVALKRRERNKVKKFPGVATLRQIESRTGNSRQFAPRFRQHALEI